MTSLYSFAAGTRSTTASATGPALTPLVAGQLMIAVITATGSTGAAMTTAQASGTTGWTQLTADTVNASGASGQALVGFWYKYASGNETPAFTTGASGTITSQCDVYTLFGGPTSGNPLDTSGTFASGSSSSTIASIAVTTSAAPAAANEFAIIAAVRERTAGTSTVTVSSGWTGESNDGSTSSTGHRLDGMQANPATSGTLTGTVSFSGTSTTAFGAGAIVVIQTVAAPGAFTVTATPTGASGALLRLLVLTGATEAGGKTAIVAPGPGAQSIVPNFSNSFIVWSNNDRNSSSAMSAAANNTLLDNLAITGGQRQGSGYYSGTVTSGTAVTAGATTPDGATACTEAVYEVPASGGSTPLIDVSSPAAVSTATGSAALTTLPINPPGGAVLVAIVTGAAFPSAWTVTDSQGLTWTQRVNNTDGQRVFTATVPSSAPAVFGLLPAFAF